MCVLFQSAWGANCYVVGSDGVVIGEFEVWLMLLANL